MQARYFAPADADGWDAYCAGSHCATFLHRRKFLSYHGERFVDRSIVIESDGRWLGVLPAAEHRSDPRAVVSHPGITYGGFVHTGALRGLAMLEAFRSASSLFRDSGFDRLHYKVLPHIYHRAPAQDDLYALHRLGARCYRRDLSTCIDLQGRLPVSDRRKRSLRRAIGAGITIASGREVAPLLWPVLDENLRRKHDSRPVHSLDEIGTLAEWFPDEIGFRVASVDDEVVAGVVLFRSRPVVHAQYIASSPRGYELSALDAVFDRCIDEATAAGDRYFDFGISTEADGTVLNDGLYRFKSEFGGAGVVHEFYEVDLERAAHERQ